MKGKIFWIVALHLILITFIVGGCGGTASTAVPTSTALPAATLPSATPAPEPVSRSVRIGVVRSGSEIPLIIAAEKGFFENEGLDAEIVEFASGGAATQALVAGEVPISGFSVASTLDFFERGEPLKNLVLLQKTPITMIVTRKELNIKPGDWEALRGRKIGVSGPGGATDTLLRVLLMGQGMDPETDVEIVTTGGLDGQRAALETGQIDAQVTWEPGFSQFVLPSALNITDVFLDMRATDAPSPLPSLPQSSLVANPDYIASNPEVVRSVVRAVSCAIKAIRDDPALAGVGYRQVFPGLDDSIYENIVQREAQVFSAEITPEQIATTNEVYQQMGTLESTVAYEDVVATEFSSEWGCK